MKPLQYFLDFFFRFERGIVKDELIFDNETWQKYQRKIGLNQEWYILTPANYEYCRIIYNLNIDRFEFSQMIKDRIDILKQNGERIQILLFLGKTNEFIDYEDQKAKITEAKAFMNSNGCNPQKIFPIDGVYNDATVEIAKKQGFREIVVDKLEIINPFKKFLKLVNFRDSFIREILKSIEAKNYREIFHLLIGIIVSPRILTIHCEALVRDDLWLKLKNKLLGHNFIWFIVSPVNYDYCSNYFNLKMDQSSFTSVLKQRIKYLQENGEEVQMHIHLAKERSFLSKKLQSECFHKSIEFFKSLGIKPTKFVAGWWIYNQDTINIAKSFGIKEIYDFDINPFLKYKITHGMKVIFTHNYWHDFDFF